jgi:hypothetical protein
MPPEAESRDDQGWTWKPPLKATKSASSAGGAQKVHEGPLTRSHSAPPTEHYRNALATGDDDNDDTDSKPPLQVRVSAGAGREADEEEDGDQWGEERGSLLQESECHDDGDGVCLQPVQLDRPQLPAPRSRLAPRGERLVSTKRQVAVLCGLTALLLLFITLRATSMTQPGAEGGRGG